MVNSSPGFDIHAGNKVRRCQLKRKIRGNVLDWVSGLVLMLTIAALIQAGTRPTMSTSLRGNKAIDLAGKTWFIPIIW